VSALQRVFSIVTDIPLSEYIRRRRLTLAAFELQHSSVKIIDLALKYGYESPEAFARAFNSVHGTNPSSARDKGVQLKAYPRITFLLTVKGDTPMDYRIENKAAFQVYGLEGIFSTADGENLKAIPKFWIETMNDGRFAKLIESTHAAQHDENGLGLINAICDYRKVQSDQFPYMICAFKTAQSDVDGFVEATVPASTWAVFKTEKHTEEQTSSVLQSVIKRIYTDWLPTAAYDKVDGYELELYYGEKDQCWCEAWVRVIPKK
jgi:AraC family transcriptional regulator